MDAPTPYPKGINDPDPAKRHQALCQPPPARSLGRGRRRNAAAFPPARGRGPSPWRWAGMRGNPWMARFMGPEIRARSTEVTSDRGLISGLVPRSDALPARASQDAGMALTTGFTELFGIRHPIALAPMGGSAGGALTAAGSNGGGLGLLGSGGGERRWAGREPAVLPAGTGHPWGVGFLTWAAEPSAVDYVLERGARAVMFSFGDPSRLVKPVRQAGGLLILQVTDLDEARRAV